jgi:hypothetical protein
MTRPASRQTLAASREAISSSPPRVLAATLRTLAIELGQGYLLGRPLPVDEASRTGPCPGDRGVGQA